jgi:hypothetical protein
VLRWTCQLLLQRLHSWPHRDGAGSGIVEEGPRRGAPAIIAAVVAGAVGDIVLAFPLPLALILAFAAVVGSGDRRGKGHQRTWRFLLQWAPSS